MMTQEFIINDLGFVLSEMGFKVCNSQRWQEELGSSAPTEEAILAKWEEIKAQRASAQAAQSSYDAALSAGFDTGLGFRLSVTEYAQTRFSVLMTGLKNLAPAGSTEVPIWDQEKVKHVITYDQFKTIMQGYTLHCISIEPS